MLTRDYSDNVVGIAVTSSETPTTPAPGTSQQTCPASFTCPENNGCLYTDGSRSLTLSCGMDFYGGDLASQYAESLGACTQACARNTECVAASFVGGKGAGTCYLKSTQNNGNINDNVDGMLEARNKEMLAVLTFTRSLRRLRFRESIFIRPTGYVYCLVNHIARDGQQHHGHHFLYRHPQFFGPAFVYCSPIFNSPSDFE